MNAVVCHVLTITDLDTVLIWKICLWWWQLEIFGGAESEHSYNLNDANILKIVLNIDWRGLVEGRNSTK